MEEEILQIEPEKIYKPYFFRRAFAFLFDHILFFGTIILLTVNFKIFLIKHFDEEYFLTIYITISALIIQLFFCIFESILNGQTFGKKFFKIKVVKENNEKLDFYCIFIRNFARCVYFLPPLFFIPDFLFYVFSKKHQRIGDILAGTLVSKTE